MALPRIQSHSGVGDAAITGLSIEILGELHDAEADWRAFEASASPYQRFDWAASFVGAGAAEGADLAIARVREENGSVVAILPFGLTRHAGVRTAAFLGGRHANYRLPLRRAEWSPDAALWRALLAQVGDALGADLVTIDNVPTHWTGDPVPLAALGRPAVDLAYAVALQADGDATLRTVMSGETRRKLRNKGASASRFGRLAFVRAADPATADALLDAFYRQKSRRLRDQGVADPFVPAVRAFLADAVRQGLAAGTPAIDVFGLTLDGLPIAVFGAVADRRRASGMFISFSPEHARVSPGEQLVARVIGDYAERGRAIFDLGVGEAEYKNRFCPIVETLVDVAVPVTAIGRLKAAAAGVKGDAKRRIKGSGGAMRLVKAVRRATAGTTTTK